jgi:hypothetical protein
MEKAGVAFGLATMSVVFAAVVFVAENARDAPMQFIERQFGFSPDGGDGSIEVLVVIVLVAIISLGALRLATIPTSVRNEKRTRNYKRSG